VGGLDRGGFTPEVSPPQEAYRINLVIQFLFGRLIARGLVAWAKKGGTGAVGDVLPLALLGPYSLGRSAPPEERRQVDVE